MRPRLFRAWWLCLAAASAVAGAAPSPGPAGMAKVEPGSWRPLYPPTKNEREIPVQGFWLERRPVTNAEFLAFVRREARWQRDRVPRPFADGGYLAHWAGPLEPGPEAALEAPVVHVSWFAAKAYCAALGRRLPRESEWELAAAADETRPDAHEDPVWRRRILDWYARPRGPLALAGSGPANYWGVRDLHGLVWEWVLDFNSALVAVDGRAGGDGDRLKFCGAGAALAAGGKDDYASFMRLAFRSSLEGAYTTSTLGFRCAQDLELP